MTPFKLVSRFNLLQLVFFAVLAVVLQGCFHSSGGGGGGGGITPDANPEGYYINTGSATVSDGAGGTMTVDNLQAIVNGTRIMMMSVPDDLLYDGTITSISGNSFTADFKIYFEGGDIANALPMTATASGTITEGSSITGTLTGSGVGSGTFSLTYAMTNNELSAFSRIENVAGTNDTWGAIIGGGVLTPQEFIIDATGALTHDTVSAFGIFASCEMNGSLTPITDSSLYSVSVVLTRCGSSDRDGTYTGLAVSRTDATTDDTLVFMTAGVWLSPNGDFK